MKGSALSVIGLFLILYIAPLGVSPLQMPDETRYAEIPREIIASGDWVVPHLNGFRYFEKPPLGYWLNAASMMLFGGNAFAARLPSALSTGISGILVFLLVRRFGGGHWSGVISAAVLLSCAVVYGVGTFSVLDPVFAMFVTGAMVSFFFAHMEVRPGKRIAFLGLCGACCGLAFLTKGFVAFAVPVVAIVPFMIREGRLKEFLQLSWVPMGGAVLVVLPWAVMIHLREPDFWQYFIWTEHIRRFISGNDQHPRAFWYFVPVILLGAMPWTVLSPAAVSGLRRKHLKEPLFRFTLCWLLFPFLFFSASHGKLGTYILPCFPPLAVLMATGLLGYLEIGKKAFSLGASCLAVFLAIGAAILVTGQTIDFPDLHPYGPTETWKWILAATGMLTWCVLTALAGHTPGPHKKLVLFCTAPLLMMFCAHFIMPDEARGENAPGDFLMRNAGRVRAADTILVSNEIAGAVCWFYKRSDVLLLLNGGELAYGSSYDDSKNRVIGLEGIKGLIRDSGKNRILLIAKAKDYRYFKQHLPVPGFEDSNGRLVFVLYY